MSRRRHAESATTIRYVSALALGFGLAAYAGAALAAEDEHSVEQIVAALKAPVSEEEQKKARDADDHFLSKGEFLGFRGYLVTDPRATQRANDIVGRLLATMNQDQQAWVIRVLDTRPPVANAFVTGGKYIYVFGRLLEEAASDDELAFILSHELGHSLLHHGSRTESSSTTATAGLADLIGLLAGGEKGLARAQAVTEAMRASYSRANEAEADAFAAVLTWKAGYDPLRGADFFTRQMRQEEERLERDQQARAARRQQVVAAMNACNQHTQVYQAYRTQQAYLNAQRVCTDAENRRRAFNTEVEAYNRGLAATPPPIYRSHPGDQNRVAAVAALTDYLRGRRDEASLAKYQQTSRVVAAIRQTSPAMLQPAQATRPGTQPAAMQGASPTTRLPAPPETSRPAGPAPVAERLRHLEELRQQGLVTEQEYQEKRRSILEQF